MDDILIYSTLSRENLQQLRKLEKLNIKLQKTKNSIAFNQTCINNNLLPKYTKIKLYDPALQEKEVTNEFRQNLINEEIKSKKSLASNILADLTKEWELLSNSANQEVVAYIKHRVNASGQQVNIDHRSKLTKKLNNLYNGNCFLMDMKDKFINLSLLQLDASQRDVLNLGPSCHLINRFDPLVKKMELELLYEETLKLQKQGKITISEGFADALRNEGQKTRATKQSNLLTKVQRDAMQKLLENKDIVVRRADKTNKFVLLNYADYKSKLDTILCDNTKFKKISKDPTIQLKQKLNKIINATNAVQDNIHFQKLVGDYSPGYIYGNVKVHKDLINPPLRPIISQISTPTYKIAKQLNEILKPYIPQKYSLESSDDLLLALKSIEKPDGILASLDAESLFTNVPIDSTINTILKYAYDTPGTTPPKILRQTMESLLRICTTEAPFKHIDGSLYCQIDGVAMGSPLGPLFANFYMAELENRVLEDSRTGKLVQFYRRYVDDVIILAKSENNIEELRRVMERNSALKITYEIGYFKLPFLDVNVTIDDRKWVTDVYVKSTNEGDCLNYKSECPQKYKESVIYSYMNRAYKISSSWDIFHKEVDRIKQLLTNNNYPMMLVEQEINKFLNKKFCQKDSHLQSLQTYVLYYKNQISTQYRVDERMLREIFKEKDKKLEQQNNQISFRKYKGMQCRSY